MSLRTRHRRSALLSAITALAALVTLAGCSGTPTAGPGGTSTPPVASATPVASGTTTADPEPITAIVIGGDALRL